jgi:hypothetical protein
MQGFLDEIAMAGRDYGVRLHILNSWALRLNTRIEAEQVSESPELRSWCESFLRECEKVADFGRLAPPYGGLERIVHCWKRVRGLVG